MTARPSLALAWATNANYSTGPDAGQPTKVALDAGLLADGAIEGVAPDPQKYNYLFAQIAQWQQYTDEVACLTKTATVAAFAANTNNLNAGTDFYAGATELLVTATGAFDLTGIVAPSPETPLLRRIRNRGAQPITLKHQNGSSTAANRFAISTGGDFVLAAGTAVWVTYDVIDDRWIVQVAGTGGGGAGTLFATLSAGPSAGGLNVADVGIFSSSGELTVRQAANDILRTASGTTILRSQSAAIVLRKGANDIALFNETAGVQSEMLFAAVQPTARIGALATASGPGVTLSLRAGAPGGAGAQAGGRVNFSGTAPLGGGAVGGVDIFQTDGVTSLATFNNAAITLSAPITATSSVQANSLSVTTIANAATLVASGSVTGATVTATTLLVAEGTITVHGSGSGVPVAAVGHIRGPAGMSIFYRNFVSASPDLVAILCSGAAGNGITFANDSTIATDVRSGTTVRLFAAGSPRLTVTSTGVLIGPTTLLMQPNGSITASSGGGAGAALNYLGQAGDVSTNALGGEPYLAGGQPGGSAKRAGAKMALRTNAGALETMVHVTEVAANQRVFALFGDVTATEMPAGTGDLVEYMKNCAVVPSANPVGGGIRYVEAGALKYRGSGGTVTVLAAA